MIRWMLILSLLCCRSEEVYAQDNIDVEVEDFTWLKELTDSVQIKTDLCTTCQIPPLIRSYRTTFGGILRFAFFYQCDEFISLRQHFESDGTLIEDCRLDSTKQDCPTSIVFETFTLSREQLTIWSCDGYDCNNAPKSLLFAPYEIVASDDFCIPSIKNLTISESFDAYEWTSPDGNIQTDKTSVATLSGTYRLVVFNPTGCTDTSFIDIDLEVSNPLEIVGSRVMCDSLGVELSLSGYQNYLWSTGDETSSVVITEPGLVNVEIQDDSGCMAMASVMILDNREASISIVTAAQDVFVGQNIELDLAYNNGNATELSDIIWSDGENELEGGISASFPIRDSTIISVVAIDTNGCILETEIRVIPQYIRKDLDIPNVFRPGSNENSRFYITAPEGTLLINSLTIYNRWGVPVFQNNTHYVNDPMSGWDGTSDGKVMSAGVYIYSAEVQFVDEQETRFFKGDLLLVK